MDMVNTILNSPPITARTDGSDPFNLPPLPPSFKAIANALTQKPTSPTGTVVMGIPSLPNSARDMMFDTKYAGGNSNRTSSVILISPRTMDDCMGMLRMPSLTMSERMAFL
jgi:hypothetical protein